MSTTNLTISADWKNWLILVIAIVSVITSGVAFFTAKYKLKTEGQKTEVENITNASMINFILSFIIAGVSAILLGLVYKNKRDLAGIQTP